ncbi:glycosyltransferase family 2 protein [Spirosoma rhododendri]|uniref:Glycosyltransferase family 2 protein n=1 Tax=Spirosoma rhododendri TaxID=2728024 RepID=A0A7L5DFU0_9BACT|nr:glycosyltransferase family 2 protein [Spirosoma rhododendri]QJD77024.1 glycosyltransferase family 2 protein [Spirosoma rhododendri]
MTNGYPLVSIVTLNYNQLAVTCALLQSIQTLTYPCIEVLVADNQSAEDPTGAIAALNYPNTRVIVNPANLGFAGGNNAAIRQAQGDYILLLNNDTEVVPDLIEQLLAPFASDPSIGITAPKIRYYQSPDTLQYAGYTAMNPYTGQAWAIGNQQPDRGQYDRPGLTHFAHGAAMMVRRDVIEQVGLMYDDYFLYYEELDWCWQISKAGYGIYYQPTALVYHKESVTVGKSSPLKVYYQTRNRILFIRRNMPWRAQAVFGLYYALLAFPKNLLHYALTGQRDRLRAFWRGTVWHLTHPVHRATPSSAQFDLTLQRDHANWN